MSTSYFTQDDGPGIKMGPVAILVMCASFVGSVVLLHVYGKLTS